MNFRFTKMIECTVCNGDRQFEVVTGYDPRDGQPTGYHQTCGACHGDGAEEIELQPITMDDLEEMSQ